MDCLPNLLMHTWFHGRRRNLEWLKIVDPIDILDSDIDTGDVRSNDNETSLALS